MMRDDLTDECRNQAVVTPGRFPAKDMDSNAFHASFGHAHESLLKTTEVYGCQIDWSPAWV